VGRRLRLTLAVSWAALAAACFSPPHFERFTFASTDPAALSPTLIAYDVEGSYCKRYTIFDTLTLQRIDAIAPDYALAVADALEKAPGANVLVDADLRLEGTSYWLWSTTCAVVRGHAAHVP
jgi:hypothetical protein